jgi:hypothetical protein
MAGDRERDPNPRKALPGSPAISHQGDPTKASDMTGPTRAHHPERRQQLIDKAKRNLEDKPAPTREQMAAILADTAALSEALLLLPSATNHVPQDDAVSAARLEAHAIADRLRQVLPLREVGGWPEALYSLSVRLRTDLEIILPQLAWTGSPAELMTPLPTAAHRRRCTDRRRRQAAGEDDAEAAGEDDAETGGGSPDGRRTTQR